MINQLGIYRCRNGELVDIVRLLKSQPIAEGYAEKDGKKVMFVWRSEDGYRDRWRESEWDIVEFVAFHESEPD